MNVRKKALSMALAFIVLLSQGCDNGRKDEKALEKTNPISVGGHSGPFTESFSQLLQSYYELHRSFVLSDTTRINAAATSVQLNTTKLNLSGVGGDSTGTIEETARLFTATISSSATALLAENSLPQKLREFNMISDALWNLARTVRYDGQKLYYQYCADAFENTGGYWLSDTTEVRNPYYPERLPSCGELTDSVDYSKK